MSMQERKLDLPEIIEQSISYLKWRSGITLCITGIFLQFWEGAQGPFRFQFKPLNDPKLGNLL